jgi:hypothetical protein
MTLLIEDAHDLERAAQLATRVSPPAVDEVYVRLPWLDGVERLRAARALGGHFGGSVGPWGRWRLRRLLARLARGGVLVQRAGGIGRRPS